jgi:hypothetical protein
MADPGTKGTLTLLNLIAEEEAALNRELGEQVTSSFLETNLTYPLHDFRNISIAGDDHAAIGNKAYLNAIGANHEKNNMVLSRPKHGTSSIGMKYCEEYFVKTDKTSFTNPGWDYEKMLMVDTFKTAFVSPESKQQQEATNPSIGKGAALFKRIGWAPPGWEGFGNKVVRARFFARHAKYLPKEGKAYDRKIELPFLLGGLQMSPWKWVSFEQPPFLKEDGSYLLAPIRKSLWDSGLALKSCSDLHLAGIEALLKGELEETRANKLKLILGRFSGNRYARGISQDLTDRNERIYKDFLEGKPAHSLSEIVPKLEAEGFVKPHQGYRHQTKAAGKAGYTTIKDLSQRIGELEIQQELFRTPPSSDMKPAGWENRYARLDKDLADFGLTKVINRPGTISLISGFLQSFNNVDSFVKELMGGEKYIHKDDLIHMDEAGDLVSIPAEILRHRPNLQLPSLFHCGETTLSTTTTELGAISPN